MALTDQQILAREARIRDARATENMALGQLALSSAWATQVASMNSAASKAYQDAKGVREALEAGGTVSSLDSYGQYSSIDQLLRAERFAGKSAAVDFVKANPSTDLQPAIDAWTAAALTATGLPALVQSATVLQNLYAQHLAAAGLISDATWPSQRDWMVATDKATIMGS